MKHSTHLRLEKKAQIWSSIVSNQVFHLHDKIERQSLKTICDSLRKHMDVLKKLRDYHKFEEHLTDLWASRQLGTPLIGRDVRAGKDSYGYKSIEKIEGDLDYISDRFGCTFRLQWLIELPDAVDELLRLTYFTFSDINP